MLLAAGTHPDPHTVLGAHPHPDGTVVRALRPHADSVAARIGEKDYPLVHVAHGVFEGVVPFTELWDYRFVVSYPGGQTVLDADGYRFLPTIGELDLHLIGEGRHERLWDVLGAHPRSYTTLDGEVSGTSFAVWAPNARGVSVIGDFDGWSGNSAPMRKLGGSGIWELFVPGIGPGAKYKFRVHGADGRTVDHADPLAFATEPPPATASVVTESTYQWQDRDWLAERERTDPTRAPMSIYEVHLGSWRPDPSYREAADRLAEYVLAQGYTHVELLPIAEHPFGGSWGYQVTSYYAPTARFGTPDDFRAFVDRLHRAGIGVLLDWVPAHFPRDEWALARFDGTALYEHADPRRGEQLDWGTYVFDFGRYEVRNFLVANALYWIEEFHIDGLRVDAVASMLYLDYSRPEGGWEPNVHGGRENLEAVAFLQEMNATVHKHHPGVVTVAEESTSWPGVTRATDVGGLGFTMKWNMGWMHDTLGYLGRDQIHRGWHHNEITFSMVYAWSENFVLPISHDEVVHGKGTLWTRMPGDDWAKACGVRALLAYMWAHPGKQLLFMGQDFGQFREWSHDRGLDWDELDNPLHDGIRALVRDLNTTYRAHPALWSQDTSPGGYAWIEADDRTNNVIAFLRHGSDGSTIACVCNFSGAEHRDYRVGLPTGGRWREILNTDAQAYGGSGIGNLGSIEATNHPWHGRPHSAAVTLAPNSAVWLAPE
ncbi:1,4-alpha-glucan branching protein GlgB [Nocardia sp. CDC159]|uniref:1,4-alpha-glucan branching enzyme GlgB n=1 Tax=Nocardia pulmonis TaxID=2951408 RepID=A0A9X2J1K2_9NOCA|nr:MULTISPECIES: 1,4-alpha-glucan branching protein GlgB [Nocardia]MCM6778180.1 1,4-alpha-glucan branching protein GlgB [Nocardia pulmonis]MCM6791069.1 1,4-alpha-glucan branching protein GlgB [Nocardia sp. CDC159]